MPRRSKRLQEKKEQQIQKQASHTEFDVINANASVSFKPHMSLEELQQLKVGDRIDYRFNSFYYPAIITQKDESKGMIKLRCLNPPSSDEREISYVSNVHRFAEFKSIFARPAHRLKDIKIGSLVDINPVNFPGWRKGEVIHIYHGQAKVLCKPKRREIKRNPWETFVHLDNINEVDRFGIHTQEIETNHIPLTMETKRAYLNTPNDMKEDCAKEIIDNVYGGMTNILSYLIKNAATCQLQEIQKIIKQKNIQYQEKQIELKFKDDETKLTNDNDAIRYILPITSLSQLSSNSITNICGYLEHEDTKSFKLTSFRNGMICLREMTKCNIGIFNTNELINDEKQKYVDSLSFVNTVNTNRKYTRYPANIKHLTLQQIWYEKYDIPLSEQLLCAGTNAINNINYNYNGTTPSKYWVFDSEQNIKMAQAAVTSTANNIQFIIFDKRNMIQFDEIGNVAKIANNSKLIDVSQPIMLLSWFDIFEQEIISLQFVTGNRDIMTVGRLTKYIEKEFIVTTEQQKIWRSNMLSKFKKMNQMDSSHSKLLVHKQYDTAIVPANNPIEKIAALFLTVTFQLNPNHPTFAKKQFCTIGQKYQLLTSQDN